MINSGARFAPTTLREARALLTVAICTERTLDCPTCREIVAQFEKLVRADEAKQMDQPMGAA